LSGLESDLAAAKPGGAPGAGSPPAPSPAQAAPASNVNPTVVQNFAAAVEPHIQELITQAQATYSIPPDEKTLYQQIGNKAREVVNAHKTSPNGDSVQVLSKLQNALMEYKRELTQPIMDRSPAGMQGRVDKLRQKLSGLESDLAAARPQPAAPSPIQAGVNPTVVNNFAAAVEPHITEMLTQARSSLSIPGDEKAMYQQLGEKLQAVVAAHRSNPSSASVQVLSRIQNSLMEYKRELTMPIADRSVAAMAARIGRLQQRLTSADSDIAAARGAQAATFASPGQTAAGGAGSTTPGLTTTASPARLKPWQTAPSNFQMGGQMKGGGMPRLVRVIGAVTQTVATSPQDLGQANACIAKLRENTKWAKSEFLVLLEKVVKGDWKLARSAVVDPDGRNVDITNPKSTTTSEGSVSAASVAELVTQLTQLSKHALTTNSDIKNHEQQLNEIVRKCASLVGHEGTQSSLSSQSLFQTIAPMAITASKATSTAPLSDAKKLIEEGKDEDALLLLEADVVRDPKSVEGWCMLGELHLVQDMDELAIQCFKSAYLVQSTFRPVLLSLGLCLGNEDDVPTSLKMLREWLGEDSKFSALVKQYVVNADVKKDAQKTEEMLKRATKASEKDVDLWVAQGGACIWSGNFEGAGSAFAKAINLQPSDPRLWSKLGASLSKAGKHDKAVQALLQALEIKPRFPRARANLGSVYIDQKKMIDACQQYMICLVLNPKCSYVWDILSEDCGFSASKPELHKAICDKDKHQCMRILSMPNPAELPRKGSELSAAQASDCLKAIGVG